MAMTKSNARKDYYFVLQQSSYGTLTLNFVPNGWDSGEEQFIRNETYHGVFRTMTTKELEFVKEGKQFITNVYETFGVDAVITLNVYKLNKSTYSYALDYSGKIDLATYVVDAEKVSVQVLDTAFSEKIKNRESVVVNLLGTTTIEGMVLSDIPYVDKFLNMPDIEVALEADFVRGS